MRQSQYFLKTSKTQPSDDPSVNARLLEQGGFVQKVMAGVYTFLPLGLRVLAKIEDIVRAEMDKIGAGEVLMPALQPKENWAKTGRWDELDVLFRLKSRHGYDYALGPTHEEIVTPAALPVISSYRDLPLAVYQIQTKFRDEPRAKSGLLRTREFRMKDLYSFHTDEKDLNEYYEKVAIPAYQRIYRAMGLDAVLTEASGGTFSKFSHEFQVEIPSGEDYIYVCEKCGLAKNKEIFEEGVACTVCGGKKYREAAASEVGNIFPLKTKYSKSFELTYTDEKGKKQDVVMGCYGIGTSRLLGVLVEKYHDSRGIIWPRSVAPFDFHLLLLDASDPKVAEAAEQLYGALQAKGVEVLLDDRDMSAGVKFVDSDLIGIPRRLVVSARSVEKGSFELKARGEGKTELIELRSFEKLLSK
ncbi:MAG: His/Gly/Thr/Pro-type tRNA ligase C-terminal domain-containing protein [Patescibacteria group bacterium]|nr:His/Gly/Thr/Pro-type tRNA ligase C-terminal domain-containing protein [Patescibacteria group bacterium]